MAHLNTIPLSNDFAELPWPRCSMVPDTLCQLRVTIGERAKSQGAAIKGRTGGAQYYFDDDMETVFIFFLIFTSPPYVSTLGSLEIWFWVCTRCLVKWVLNTKTIHISCVDTAGRNFVIGIWSVQKDTVGLLNQ